MQKIHVLLKKEELDQERLEGKVVVVNLWAMWCAPCKAEMPTLQALAKAYEANEDLVVLPINVDAILSKPPRPAELHETIVKVVTSSLKKQAA